MSDFHQILNCLLSTDNDVRSKAEVSCLTFRKEFAQKPPRNAQNNDKDPPKNVLSTMSEICFDISWVASY